MIMLKIWRWYQNCLAMHPLKTQIVSSGIIWGCGDIAAQAVTQAAARRRQLRAIVGESKDEVEDLKINWRRVASTALFGLGFVGPVGHFWYEGLDRIIKFRFKYQPNSFKFVASKVKEDVKRDFLPALVLEGGIWPIVQVANFRFIPVRYQLLYVNFFCLLDSCFLSWIEQQQDAPWKQWFRTFAPLKEKREQGK